MRNTLATVQAVLDATLASSAGMSEFRRAFHARIASLANTHALITRDRRQEVPLDALLRFELEAYARPRPSRVALGGPRVLLASDMAVPPGMAFHEFTVNGSIREPRP